MARRRKRLEPEVPPLSPLPPQPGPLSTAWRVAAGVLTLVYILLSIGHLLTTPVAPNTNLNYTNAPDEAAHAIYVQAIAEGARLPIPPHTERVGGAERRVEDPRFHTYEWHQPPLYYLLAAPLYGLGIHALRALGILLGVAGIWVIFLGARQMFPEDPPLAVLALGFAALLPMRHAITAAAGNDPATELAFSLTALACLAVLRRGLTPKRAALLGLCLAAALLTKATALVLLPVAALTIWRARSDGESSASVSRGAGIVLAVLLVGTGWWFTRNLTLFGEFTPMRAFNQEFASTSRATDWIGKPLAVDPFTGDLREGPEMSRLGYLQLVAAWTARTFFAAYTPPRKASIGVPAFLPPQLYLPYALLGIAAIYGLCRQRPKDWSPAQRSGALVLLALLALVAGAFGAFVWTYFQATGRYLYPALLPISVAWALGIRQSVPPARRDVVSTGVLLLLAVLAAGFLFAAVIPAYSAVQ